MHLHFQFVHFSFWFCCLLADKKGTGRRIKGKVVECSQGRSRMACGEGGGDFRHRHSTLRPRLCVWAERRNATVLIEGPICKLGVMFYTNNRFVFTANTICVSDRKVPTVYPFTRCAALGLWCGAAPGLASQPLTHPRWGWVTAVKKPPPPHLP